MKQIIKQLMAVAILLFSTLSTWAYDFEVDGIYYGKYTDRESVYVTYKDTNYNSYSGSVVIPSTVTYSGTTYSVASIDRYAFFGCTGLTSVTIPNSVTSIGGSAFYNCSGLTKVTISDIASWCNIHFGDNPLHHANHLYLNGTEVTNLVIPNSVTSIGDDAFSGCSGLTSVTIPNSVTSIGGWAFYKCSGLTSVTIGNSVTSIGESTFRGCSGLTSVTIPNSVTSIGGWAFYYCSGLTSVLFNAENCTTMGTDSFPVFQGCSNLTSLTIGENVKTIPNNAFKECSRLTSVAIGKSVTTIGDLAFENCSRLTSVTIGNSVTWIGRYAFHGCSGLTSVTIPYSVTSIGDYAFYDCSKILSFTSQNATPPTVPSESTFQGMPRSCQLYVPASSKVAYQTATGWTFFTFVNAFGEGDIETINSDAVKVTTEGGAIRVNGGDNAVAEVYSLSGALLYRGTDATITLPRGVYIVKVAETTTKVVL